MKRLFLSNIQCIALMFFLLFQTALQAQTKVLFVGNSYTEFNNLPQMTAEIAGSMGFTMNWTSNTPGGCTFSQHCTNESMTLIRQGGWDFVVLQEQSQYPSFPQHQVESEVFPFAERLVDSVYAASPCAEPMFYMTWGRKNGDASNAQFFPILGTYEGMDSMLYERYMQMAESNDASVCPVGRVWRYLRENHDNIELYQTDGSHPTVAGTYVAACAFAVMFFKFDPELVSYEPSGITPLNATTIRHAVKAVVYDQIERWRRPRPQSDFEIGDTNGLEVSFVAHVAHSDSMVWHFGDGVSFVATDSVVWHTYETAGNYDVTLVASRHCMTDTALMPIHIDAVTDTTTEGIDVWELEPQTLKLAISPNPAKYKPTVTIDGEPVNDNEITVVTSDGRNIPFSSIDFGNIPAGLYLISVKHQGATFTGRFVKMK